MIGAGILILAALFFGAGSMLGVALNELVRGNLSDFTSEPAPMWFTLVANPLCWLCIWLLWRKASRAAPLHRTDSRLKFMRIALRGLPVTDRIGFLAFTVLWILGFLFGLIMPLFDPPFAT